MFYQRQGSGCISRMRRLVKRLEQGRDSPCRHGRHGGLRARLSALTDDVDVLLTPDGFAEFRERFVPKDYEPVPGRTAPLHRPANDVTVDILVTGLFPGSGRPGPIAFPIPEPSGEAISKVYYIDLLTLDSAEARRPTPSGFRRRGEPDRAHNLDESFLDRLHPSRAARLHRVSGRETPRRRIRREGRLMSRLLLANLFYETADGRIVLHAMPLLLGVLCVLAIAYRYYSAFLAAKVAALDDSPRDAGPPLQRRPELPSDQQVGAVRPSLRRHLRRRAAHRAGAGDPVRLHAGPALAGDRRLPGRRGAGHARAGRVGAPRRQVAGRDRPHRAGPAGRRRRLGGHPVHRRHRPGRAWASSSSRRWAARRSSLAEGHADRAARRRASSTARRRRADARTSTTFPGGCTIRYSAGERARRRGSRGVPGRGAAPDARLDGPTAERRRDRCRTAPCSSSPAVPGAPSPSPAPSRSPCSSACTCTGSARAASSRRRSSAPPACWRRRSPATGFPARRWRAVFSLTQGPDDPGADRLRLHRLGAAGLAAAVPARLPVELPQDRHHRPAGRRRASSPIRRCRARRSTTIFLRRRADLPGRHLPVRLHLHHVRRDLRLPCPGLVRHHAEDDRQGKRRSGRSATGRC